MKLPVVGDVYKHYKGGRYVVAGLAMREADCEVLVLYRKADGRPDVLPWCRPLDEWEEWVTPPTGCHRVQRFCLEGGS